MKSVLLSVAGLTLAVAAGQTLANFEWCRGTTGQLANFDWHRNATGQFANFDWQRGTTQQLADWDWQRQGDVIWTRSAGQGLA